MLVAFAVIALVAKAFAGWPPRRVTFEGKPKTYESIGAEALSWMSPSGVPSSALIAGLVVAVFIYWGWDTCVSVNEEAKDSSSRTPRTRRRVVDGGSSSLIYLVTAYGSVALLGPDFVTDNAGDAIYALGEVALPSFMVKLLDDRRAHLGGCVVPDHDSARPLEQCSRWVPTARLPPKLARKSIGRRLTPDFSTWLFGGRARSPGTCCSWSSATTRATDAYSASIAAVGLAIAVYYGLSGISCIVLFRRHLLKSVRHFVMIGVLPAIGGVTLLYVFCKTVIDAYDADYAPGTVFGVGTVLVFGTLLLALGVPLMLICARKYPAFFRYRPDPAAVVKDPTGSDVLAAPLGTYRKETN